MSLYGQYIKELKGKEIVESNKGFATYFFLKDHGVYIEDIYVHADFRHEGVAAQFADQIAEIAKQKGFTKMFGSVLPSNNNSTDSLKVLLAYGFRLDSCGPMGILMVKDI